MRRAGTLLLLAAACAVLGGCNPANARVGVSTGPAFLYKNVETPMTVRRGERGGPPQPLIIPADLRKGEATFYCISPLSLPPGTGPLLPGMPDPLGVGWGDGSMEKAMENGEIGEVLYADARELSILRIFTKITIKAYGTPQGSPKAEAAGQKPP